MFDSDAEAIATLIKAIDWSRRKEAYQVILQGVADSDKDNEAIFEYVSNCSITDVMNYLKGEQADGVLRWIRENIYVEGGEYHYE